MTMSQQKKLLPTSTNHYPIDIKSKSVVVDKNIENILAKYPKTRKPLPLAYQTNYQDEYIINREGQSFITKISSSLESWMHKKVALHQGAPTLELGAGTLNQLFYEPNTSYYDIVEPFHVLFRDKEMLSRIGTVYSDISEVPGENKYSRVTSVAVLEHLTHLPYVVAKSAKCLSSKGIFQAAVPCEGEFAWFLGWRFGTGIAYKLRTGLDYSALMRHEHVNTLYEIEKVIRFFFRDVHLSRSPMFLRHTAFYAYIEATTPILSNIETYLSPLPCTTI